MITNRGENGLSKCSRFQAQFEPNAKQDEYPPGEEPLEWGMISRGVFTCSEEEFWKIVKRESEVIRLQLAQRIVALPTLQRRRNMLKRFHRFKLHDLVKKLWEARTS